MRAFAKSTAISVLLILFVGCRTSPQQAQQEHNQPQSVRPALPVPQKITVLGFVKAPGTFAHKAEMTVADALAAAGGYGECESCQDYFRKHGKHPTFDWPPRILRQGIAKQLPGKKTEWMSFPLQPQDEIRFLHQLF